MHVCIYVFVYACAMLIMRASRFTFYMNVKLANAFTVIRHRLASLFPIGGKFLIAFVQHLFVAVFSKVT